MGLEVLLGRLVGENDAFLMLGAFALLIAANFIVEMYLEVKKNHLGLDDVLRFTKLVLLNALFLFGLELLMIPAGRIPFVYDFFVTIQTAGWLGVMVFYFHGFYKNLKELGFVGNKRLDDAINNITQNKEEEK